MMPRRKSRVRFELAREFEQASSQPPDGERPRAVGGPASIGTVVGVRRTLLGTLHVRDEVDATKLPVEIRAKVARRAVGSKRHDVQSKERSVLGSEGHILLTFGLLLAAALLAGLAADYLRLPKVTAYLLIGLALGPGVLDWLDERHLVLLDPLTKLAMALVLFGLGCHFPLSRAKKAWQRAYRLSVGEIGATFVLVSLGLLLAGVDWTVAVLVAALAVESAPATTILVLRDCQSHGEVTENTNALVLLNNVAAILLFEGLFLVLHVLRSEHAPGWTIHLRFLLQDLLGATLLGLSAGLVVALCCALVAASRWLVLLVAVTTVCLGVNEILGTPYMLSFLVMGLTVANTSDLTEKIVAELDRLTGFLCVLFFVIHGAELDASAVVTSGLIGVLYLALRAAGKFFGVYLGVWSTSRWTGRRSTVYPWMGATLMAHAGLAIALSAAARARDAALGQALQAIVLGPIVVFEVLGPILIRQSVLWAGEMPLAQAVRHTSVSVWDVLRDVSRRILANLGLDVRHRVPLTELTVADFVRRVEPLQETATFDDVVQLIASTHDNTYPVVDEQSRLVGIIRYADLSRVVFDRRVSGLVNASDLARPVDDVLRSDDPIDKALELFRHGRHDVVPVVDPEDPNRLVGVIRRRDVTSFLAGRPSDSAAAH